VNERDYDACPENFLDFIAGSKGRVNRDFDLPIAITGTAGTGKSSVLKTSLFLHHGFNLEQIQNPKDKELEKMKALIRSNMVLVPDFDLFKDKIENCPKKDYVAADEVLRMMNKKTWYNADQIDLTTFFDECRKDTLKIIGMAQPMFTNFETYYRNSRIYVWIYCIGRTKTDAYGVAFLKDDIPGLSDPWNLKKIEKIWGKARGRRHVSDINSREKINILAKTPNFYFSWKLPKPSEKIINFYKNEVKEAKIAFAKKLKTKAEIEGRTKKYRKALIKLIAHLYLEYAVDQKELSKISGFSLGAINAYLKKAQVRPVDNTESNTNMVYTN